MANHNCVEPAQQPAHGQTIVLAPAGDTITFPAVDSCFAICLLLQDGSLLGGHVPAFFDAQAFDLEISKLSFGMRKGGNLVDPQVSGMTVSLDLITKLMNAQRNDRVASLAVTLGDEEWYDIWNKQPGTFGFPKQIRYRKNAGPRNLIVDSGNQRIQVQRQIGGHYLNQFAAQRQFNQGTINNVPIGI